MPNKLYGNNNSYFNKHNAKQEGLPSISSGGQQSSNNNPPSSFGKISKPSQPPVNNFKYIGPGGGLGGGIAGGLGGGIGGNSALGGGMGFGMNNNREPYGMNY